jgi:hypothetical protein
MTTDDIILHIFYLVATTLPRAIASKLGQT